MTEPQPPPPSPPPAAHHRTGLLVALGSVVTVLLVVLIAVLLSQSSEKPGRNEEAIAATAQTSPIATDSESSPTTLPASSPSTFSLQAGDILVSGASGVRIVRGTEVVGRVVTEPTEYALATPDGRVVHQAPAEFVYPEFWPGNEPIGESKVWLTGPDGATSLLYSGGASIRMFDVTLIPSVSVGPSVVAVRADVLADGSRLNSLLVIPVDGSEALVVSGVPVSVTGSAWLGEFFVLAVNGEVGDSYIAAVDLDGREVAWPLNPEPLAERDPSTRVTTIARIGGTSLIAYAVSSGGFWDGSADLVVYDTSSGQTVATLDVGVPQAIVSSLHASNEALAVSKVYNTGDRSGWSLVHVPIALYGTTSWDLISLSVPGAGTYSVVGATVAQEVVPAPPPALVLPDAAAIYNQPVDDAAALLAATGLTVDIAGIGCSNSTQPNMVRRVTVGSDQDSGIIYGKASDTFDAGAASRLESGSLVTVWTPTSNPCP